MISDLQNGNGTFSADVRLHLFVGNRKLEIASLGPDFGYLRKHHSFDTPTDDEVEGEIETIVDQKTSRWKVRITSPITADSKRFTFEAV